MNTIKLNNIWHIKKVMFENNLCVYNKHNENYCLQSDILFFSLYNLFATRSAQGAQFLTEYAWKLFTQKRIW